MQNASVNIISSEAVMFSKQKSLPFEVVLAIIYIEFALSCFSSLKLYTFYFNVYF